jgi:hypothetical protein
LIPTLPPDTIPRDNRSIARESRERLVPQRQGERQHWLVKPETIRILWVAFIIVLVLSVLAGFFIHHEAVGIIASFGFYAWFGFLSCVVLILVARFLGVFLKRPDDYYGR